MRRYVDLGVGSCTIALRALDDVIELARSLDFAALGIKLDPKGGSQGLELLRRMSDRYGIDLVGRIDLLPGGKTRLLRDLKEYRRTYGIVAVQPVSERILRLAVRDDRVDLISVTSQATAEAFSASAVKLLASEHKVLEIELSSLILSKGRTRVDLLSKMRRCISFAQRLGASVAISSGATDKYLLRSPLDQASIAHQLGMDMSEALDSLSTVPNSIIERNRARLDSRYISSGVRFAEVPKDACSPQ